MKIDILCNDGSPLGVTMKSIWGEDKRVGVGGAELVLLTLCEEWTKAGHEVTLFNDPKQRGVGPFDQEPIQYFDPLEDRDILIVFRSPNYRAIGAKGYRVWYSHDQQTTGNFTEFAGKVHKIVCVSKFHKDYFMTRYGVRDAVIIDNVVRTGDFTEKVEKIPHRFLFSSVPKRGLDILLHLWPEIKSSFPEASLVITSDYRLWGAAYPLNEEFKLQSIGLKGVQFRGAIPRKQLIQENLAADLLAYPCTYEELFCICVGEAEVAGAYPITSGVGALPTTCNGVVIPGDPKTPAWQRAFLTEISKFLTNPDKEILREASRQGAIDRLNPANILRQWDEKVFR